MFLIHVRDAKQRAIEDAVEQAGRTLRKHAAVTRLESGEPIYYAVPVAEVSSDETIYFLSH